MTSMLWYRQTCSTSDRKVNSPAVASKPSGSLESPLSSTLRAAFLPLFVGTAPCTRRASRHAWRGSARRTKARPYTDALRRGSLASALAPSAAPFLLMRNRSSDAAKQKLISSASLQISCFTFRGARSVTRAIHVALPGMTVRPRQSPRAMTTDRLPRRRRFLSVRQGLGLALWSTDSHAFSAPESAADVPPVVTTGVFEIQPTGA
jgi:hypothetical protein